jgi:hypothetical protein
MNSTTSPLDNLDAELRESAEEVLGLALDGIWSMGKAIGWARRVCGDEVAEYFRTF